MSGTIDGAGAFEGSRDVRVADGPGTIGEFGAALLTSGMRIRELTGPVDP